MQKTHWKYWKTFLYLAKKKGDQMQDAINKFETLLTRDKVEKFKQVKITSYLELFVRSLQSSR